jgi:hypothetical protein
MASLYGIESEDDCRAKIDELLELHHRAEEAMNKGTITVLKTRLREYYKMGDTEKGRNQMSPIESAWFWPAIQRAYVGSPNLASPKTWHDGLYEIGLNLRYYRPKEHGTA